MDQKPKLGIFTGADRCGNIVRGQTILITGIDCSHIKSGECNGTSYYVEGYLDFYLFQSNYFK